MKSKLVRSTWLEEQGRRLDCHPYLSDAMESTSILSRLSAKKTPLRERAHSRFPGHALTPTGVMAIRCKQFHLPDL